MQQKLSAAMCTKFSALYRIMTVLWVVFMLPVVTSYDKLFMGHATIKPGYNFVCHQKTIFNTLGGQIDSRKEYYESGLVECSIVLTSPPGTMIDFRFTDINIIASNMNTCEDASLRIYDGTSNATSLLLGFPNGICGQAVPSFTIRSSSNTMLLQLKVTSPYTSTFSAIYTAYSPRTSILCFYCGDLCLPEKSQLCDGLDNCRNAEDEKLLDCNEDSEQPPPPNNKNNQYDEDVKLILIFVFAGTSFIFLFIIIGLLLRKKLTRTCIEKRRQRRASDAAQMMLHPPHVYAQRTASGNSIPPVSLGPNRPFMAGPTVPTTSRIVGTGTGRAAPRSDMPPPYSALPNGAEFHVQHEVNAAGSQTNVSDNPTLPDGDLQQPIISDNDSRTLDSSTTTNTVVNCDLQASDAAESGSIREQETSFTDEPVQTESGVSVDVIPGSHERQLQIPTSNAATGTSEDHTQSTDIYTHNSEPSAQTAVSGKANSGESDQTTTTCTESTQNTTTDVPNQEQSTKLATKNAHETEQFDLSTATAITNSEIPNRSIDTGTDNLEQVPIQLEVAATPNSEQPAQSVTIGKPKSLQSAQSTTTDTPNDAHSAESVPTGTHNSEQSAQLVATDTPSTAHSAKPAVTGISNSEQSAELVASDTPNTAQSAPSTVTGTPNSEQSAQLVAADRHDAEEQPTAAATSGAEFNSLLLENATDVSVSKPANEIDNGPVEVSTRDIIQTLDLSGHLNEEI